MLNGLNDGIDQSDMSVEEYLKELDLFKNEKIRLKQ
jgi:hypothetical protein